MLPGVHITHETKCPFSILQMESGLDVWSESVILIATLREETKRSQRSLMSPWEMTVSPCSSFTSHYPSCSPPPASWAPNEAFFQATQHFSPILNCTRLLYTPLLLLNHPTLSLSCLISIYLLCFIPAITCPRKPFPTLQPHVGVGGPCSVLPELPGFSSPHSYHTGL